MEEPSTDLQSKVEQLGFDEGVKISVFDENFQLLATTQPQLYEEEKSNFQIEKRLRELSSELDEKGEYFENQEKEKSGNLSYLIRAQKVEGQGYIVVRTSILSIQKNMMLTDTFYILSGILTLAVGSIIIIRFSRKMVKPLEDMNQVTQQIARLNFKEYVRVDSKDELGTLAASINSMSDQLRDAMGELQKELEFRKGMVRNLAHELKTPMTSMKVLADSLLEQDNVPVEMYQEFMQDIAKEIDRENQIITDLLSLVKMDRSGQTMNIRTMNINDLLEQILKRLKPIAEKKNVEMVMETFRPVNAEIDETKFTLAVSNLVENAIKYNHENGWVHVSLNADHKYFYVKVEDSGIGIPEQDQAHIFERFYRVDKSHSREIGGTGLGLAIARNAVLVHRGSIKVYSNEGEGTTFTVRIPLIYVAA